MAHPNEIGCPDYVTVQDENKMLDTKSEDNCNITLLKYNKSWTRHWKLESGLWAMLHVQTPEPINIQVLNYSTEGRKPSGRVLHITQGYYIDGQLNNRV
jgi:hypothetical protein